MKYLVALFLLFAIYSIEGASHEGGADQVNGLWTAAPSGWTCPDAWFAEHQRTTGTTGTCDCGCGVFDPDCRQSTFVPTSCDNRTTVANSRTFCSRTAECVSAPEDWHCAAEFYNENTYGPDDKDQVTCDCECGAYDPDCAIPDPHNQVYSYHVNCNGVKAAPNTICSPNSLSCWRNWAPANWRCSSDLYDQTTSGFGTPTCDCGCGAWDPDCAKNVPLQCGGEDGSSNQRCSKSTSGCVTVPNGWTCRADLFNQQAYGGPVECNCGCGVFDPDCDLNLGSTTGLGEKVSFVNVLCSPQSSQHTEFAVCSAVTAECEVYPQLERWFCPYRWYNENKTRSLGGNNEVDCDCSCGTWDPDCEVAGATLWCNTQYQESPDSTLHCAEVDVTLQRYDGDGTNEENEVNTEVLFGVCQEE